MKNANYVGMAKKYRESLRLSDKENSNENIPLRLETIGLERKKGVLFVETIKMTSLKDMISIVKDLEEEGLDHIQISLNGFTKKRCNMVFSSI